MGTLPQEFSTLQLTGEQSWFRERRNPQADGGPGARSAHSGESCTGTDVDTEGSSRTKRPLSPGGTPQDAQSQVKCTKQKQTKTPYNS